MGNQLTFTGSGELDNGMTVSLSFIQDEGTATFDNHSVSVSRDDFGTVVLHGVGGGSATSAMDATAAGNVWDTFDATGLATGVTHTNSAPGTNAFMYTAPEIMDGLAINVSYEPQASGNTNDSGMGWSVTYTGIEGLTAIYSISDEVGTTSALSGEQTAWKLSYAYGPITATATGSDFDVQTASSDQDVSSYAVSYTVSDELSVTYGTETIESGTSGDEDAEYNKLSAAYTSGGMTVSAQLAQAENIDYSTNANADLDYWGLGLAFAF
jgi:outer membrane protein OmpU